ncbi:MAG: hypothetical protein J6L61_01755 [Ruminiclostridium sp.]|nr:hypothetical protein [Ruminiclostridium sp.]
MKFTRTLASVAAAAVAVSSLAVSAFAAWDGADGNGNLVLNVADILPEGVDINDVYGVRINFTDASADVLAQGAGGGFIFSTASNNWNQLAWCNGCGDAEEHNIQLDTATNSITRMEETPFFTAEDISGAEGTYGQIALSEWWGGDIAYSSIDFLGKDGETLPVADNDDVTPGTSEDVEETVDVAIKNAGRTVVDSGLVRTNIINAWTGDDADVIAEKADFANAVKVKVQFTVSNFTTPFKAWISFADKDWGVQYWGEGNTGNANAEATVVDVTGNGTYEVELTFANKIAAAEFIAVCTDLAAEEDATDIPTIAIDSVKIVVDNSTPDEPDEPVNPGESSGDVPDEPVNPGESSGETPVEPTPDKPVSPDTGVAVAVVPAALAAVAVATAGVVLKKRK